MLSRQANARKAMQGATVFELEASPSSRLTLKLNGLEASGTVDAFTKGSRILWYRDEAVELVRVCTGVTPEQATRDDVYYHMGNKAKIHRVVPEAGYATEVEFTDDQPLERETHYRVRVEQRNGQRAWSSPIWVREPK
jgi:hypothetical protein